MNFTFCKLCEEENIKLNEESSKVNFKYWKSESD